MATIIKHKRSQDELIKYLMDRKKETILDRIAFSKTKEFQEIRRKLKELNKP
jgi:hypothetical protein